MNGDRAESAERTKAADRESVSMTMVGALSRRGANMMMVIANARNSKTAIGSQSHAAG